MSQRRPATQDSIPASFVCQFARISCPLLSNNLIRCCALDPSPSQGDRHRIVGIDEGSKTRLVPYFVAGAGADERLRAGLAAGFFPAVVAGPLALLRALRLACSAVFPSPA